MYILNIIYKNNRTIFFIMSSFLFKKYIIIIIFLLYIIRKNGKKISILNYNYKMKFKLDKIKYINKLYCIGFLE